MMSFDGGTYKCLRTPRALRLGAATAPRTATRRTRTKHNTKKNIGKKLDSGNIALKKATKMNNAELYESNNKLQKRDALQCLEEFEKKIKWKSFDRVLDIGCGDGGVTTGILKKFIPKNFKQLIGCDISEKMVEYANEHHGDDRTMFTVLDIEGDIPQDLKGKFDHAFSFYTLHWITDQERAFTNIHDLLAPGGDCLLIFLGHMPVFDVFRALARHEKWRHCINDVDRFVSPYHDSQDPVKDIRRMMAKIGFKNIDVQCKEMCFVYDRLQDCKKAVAAVNPFEIPLKNQEEFLEDYLQMVRNMRLIDMVNNNLGEPGNIRTNYSLLVAFGTKSEDIKACSR